MRVRIGLWSVGALGFLWATPAAAEDPARTAGAEVSIWFRSSEGCPNGPGFLAKLTQRSTQARLAQVGDRIDFVVTLGSEQGVASGRLERQTDSGTVAIRDIHGSSCEVVAEALALTLALTAAPGAEEEPPPIIPVTLADSAPRADKPETLRIVLRRDRRRPRGDWEVGVLGLGLATDKTVALGVGPGVEFGLDRAPLDGPSVRVGGYFLHSVVDPNDVQFQLIAARLELCPLSDRSGDLVAKLCAGGDLGQARGSDDVPEAWLDLLVDARLLVLAGNQVAVGVDLGLGSALSHAELATGEHAPGGLHPLLWFGISGTFPVQ
jgi:hypothetical protein